MNAESISQFMDHFRGVFPAVPTPMTDDCEIDEAAIGRIIDHLVVGGVHGLWVMGSGSGFAAFSLQERSRVVQTVFAANRNRLPILVGVSDTSLSQVIANTQEAARLGATAVFAIPPYYYFLDECDVRTFFEQLASASPLPVVIYYNPFNSKIRFSLDTIATLADHPNIVGIKDSSCEFSFHLNLLACFADREDFRVFQGDDGPMAASVLHGTVGLVAATPAFAPQLVVELYQAAVAGDSMKVRRLQPKCTDLLNVFTIRGPFDDSNFLAGQHAALAALGLCGRTPPSPCRPYSDQEIQQVHQILSRNGLVVPD